MARKLKVYRAEIGGLHEWIVAAHTLKEAADLWGVDADVFRHGRGGPTTKTDAVKAAMRTPGTPLRRLKDGKGAYKPIPKSGDLESWSLAAKAAGIDPKRPPKRTSPTPKAKPAKAQPRAKPARVRAPPKPPSRAALAKAERAFKLFETRAGRQREWLQAEREKLDDRAVKIDKRLAAERTRLTAALDDARNAYDKARG